MTSKIFDEYRDHLRSDISGYLSYDDYVDERIARLQEALEWIQGACHANANLCACGKPTGVEAIYQHASRALREDK